MPLFPLGFQTMARLRNSNTLQQRKTKLAKVVQAEEGGATSHSWEGRMRERRIYDRLSLVLGNNAACTLPVTTVKGCPWKLGGLFFVIVGNRRTERKSYLQAMRELIQFKTTNISERGIVMLMGTQVHRFPNNRIRKKEHHF